MALSFFNLEFFRPWVFWKRSKKSLVYGISDGYGAPFDVLQTSSVAKIDFAMYNYHPHLLFPFSLSPSRVADEFKLRDSLTPVRTMIRDSFSDMDAPAGTRGISGTVGSRASVDRSLRLKSPSVGRTVERTRDELIDSIIYTRTAENRVMPGKLCWKI